MIVIARSFVLAQPDVLHADNPILSWNNRITIAQLAASSEDAAHPATNLANPDESLKWRAAGAGEHTITLTPEGIYQIDHVAIARHNLGSAAIPIVVEGRSAAADDYTSLVETVLAEDLPAIFRFAGQSFESLRLRFRPGSAAPEIAILYAGALTVFQDGVEAPHTPLVFARVPRVANNFSESGLLLNRLVVGGRLESSITFTEIDETWFRDVLDPFVKASQDTPFFIAPHPARHPREVAFAAMKAGSNPQPTFSKNARVSIKFDMVGGAP